MSIPPVRKAARKGFSLVEALVVLAVSGMALAVVFSIGTRAGDAGFALGRRAMAAADQDLSAGMWRTVVESILLVPARLAETGRAGPVVGSSERLETEVVMARATPCAPAGWRGRLVLTLERSAERVNLVCAGAEGAVRIMDLGPGGARFSYSEDGRAWVSEIDTGAMDDRTRLATPLQARSLFVRLESRDRKALLAEISTGRPESWIRPDDAL